MKKILLLIGMVVLMMACSPVADTTGDSDLPPSPDLPDDVTQDDDIEPVVNDDPDLPPSPPQPSGDNTEPVDQVELIETTCNAAGGHWNDCGSPCAGTGDDFCIEMCEAMCECGGIAGFACPDGYTCRLSGSIADEMGKCVLQHARG